jgi:hypothetical protein
MLGRKPAVMQRAGVATHEVELDRPIPQDLGATSATKAAITASKRWPAVVHLAELHS